MNKKILLLCGGKSPEHRISLISAQSVIDNIDTDLFDVNIVGISQEGTWYHHGKSLDVSNAKDPNKVHLNNEGKPIVYLSQNFGDRKLFSDDEFTLSDIDVLYPVLHGEYGEDGSIQGLAKLTGIPIVGCDVLGASATMDKDVTKRLLRDGGVRIADFITLRKGETISYTDASAKLGKELFIKPVNLGSSVGVSCATDETSFDEAIKTGFQYDRKLIIEEKIIGREVECAVLGNIGDLSASTIGEVAPKTEFYTFENKYVNGDDGATLYIPAPISDDKAKEIQTLAMKAYTLCECMGLSRVDFFLEQDGGLILNEINSLPGFTSVSMYPKLWEHAGLPYQDLITKLIHLAIEK